MTKNIITDYLKVQLNRAYENENYFVDGDDFLDNGLEDYTDYSHDNKQAFYELWDNLFMGSEYESLIGLQLFVLQNMRVPNHMYGLNRVSYHAPSDNDIITVLVDMDLLIDVAFNFLVRRYVYNHLSDLFADDDLFCEEGLMELADKL